MSIEVREKRREARRRANGAVRIRFSNPEPLEIVGRLIDVSASGFRMAHECALLSSGQLVEFSHPEAKGRAKVMWNRILMTGVESGFFILAKPSAVNNS